MTGIKSNILERGVTIIELIMVLAVLVLIIGTVASIFISMVQGQSRSLKEQDLFNQASYVMEYISRQATSAVPDAIGSCLGSGFSGYHYRLTRFDSVRRFYQGIKFVAKDGTCQEFFLANNAVKEIRGSSSAQNILSDNFEVEYLRFVMNGDKSIDGSSPDDSLQARVTFVLKVKAKGQNQSGKILQTTFSQRLLHEPE